MTVLDADDVMRLIAKLLFYEHATWMQLANTHASRPLLHTPVFDVRYRLTQLLDPQISLETVCLRLVTVVSLYCPQLKRRQNSSPGSPMAPDFLNMTVWVCWRHVLGVVIFFLVVFLVVILLPAHINDDSDV